ncbi:F0F1 ATP synthase subunit B [Rhodopirellula bahusiensis]|uniref:ATP synthase subunit b n=1 Tax=Rhodopirellula bahusiensis TaxID=2014065 RepID=A0A2G1VZK6_9BACT|nr:F0F1 ATP synthase subunit B [Rhodopirellula bahusiensis]PHQ32161.1 ATP synthase F0 subunit B [Rhodopirellula bahusiensis]
MKRLLAISSLTLLASLVLLVVSPARSLAAQDEVTVVDARADAADSEDGDHDHDHEGDDHGHDEAAGDEHGHGDEDHAATPLLSFDGGSAIWNLIIFLCVLAILSKFVWPAVLGGLQAREEKIREDLESAEKASAEAKQMLSDYQLKLDEAAGQVQTMLADARRDAEANGQKIVDAAKVEAAAQRERALSDIENAKKVAMAEMAGQTSKLAMQVARSVVGRELSADDHADLIRQSMERLPSQN